MRLTSIVAIFALFWALAFFLVLPFRLRRRDDDADAGAVRGQMPGAPPGFSFGRTAWWTTVVAAALFGFYYLNYVEGWLPVDRIDFLSAHVYER